MRVIAGSARRLLLKAPQGLETRPTSDMVKETLFNILMPDLYDAVFLDLFAGSGAIGIEALSRGAKRAVFVEKSKQALECIKYNLHTTHFEDCSTIMANDAASALRILNSKETFDILFMDPPYDNGYEKEMLSIIADSNLLSSDAIIVVEALKSTDFSFVEDLGMTITKIKEYKNNKHVFIEKN